MTAGTDDGQRLALQLTTLVAGTEDPSHADVELAMSLCNEAGSEAVMLAALSLAVQGVVLYRQMGIDPAEIVGRMGRNLG